VDTSSITTLLSPEHREDPYPAYRVWREAAPLMQVNEGFLVATGHGECSQVLRDQNFGHYEPASGEDVTDGLVDEQGREVRGFLSLNPPDHTRLRRLVSSAFTPRMVDRLQPRIEQIAKELVDDAVEAGKIDLMSALAAPLPVVVICELLGVPLADRDRFAGWSHAMARAIDPPFLLPQEAIEPAVQARREFAEYFRDLAAHRRRQPGDDLLSALVAVSDTGEMLTENELVVTLTLLLVAGHETTTNLIGNGTLALLRHPDRLRAVRENPDLVAGAVEEVLRYDSPVQLTARVALADTTIGAHPAPAGTYVVAMVGAANRDPAVHRDPDMFDPAREATRHLAFGQGIHFCIGAPLARLEGRIAFRELTSRSAGLELAGEPSWKQSVTLRGLAELPVAFG
jgi:cytochrome P450